MCVCGGGVGGTYAEYTKKANVDKKGRHSPISRKGSWVGWRLGQSETPLDHRRGPQMETTDWGQTEVLQGAGQPRPPHLGVLTCTHALHLYSLRAASCWTSSSTRGSSFCTHWMGFSMVSVSGSLPAWPGPPGWPHSFPGLLVSGKRSRWRGSADASGFGMASPRPRSLPRGAVVRCEVPSFTTQHTFGSGFRGRSPGLSHQRPGTPG